MDPSLGRHMGRCPRQPCSRHIADRVMECTAGETKVSCVHKYKSLHVSTHVAHAAFGGSAAAC